MVEKDAALSRRVALMATALGSFLTPFMGAAVNLALPDIGREWGLGVISLGWVASVFLLAAAMVLLPSGRLADMYGRKKVFTIGVVVYTIFSLLSALSPGPLWLYAFRALQGVGGAMIFGTAAAILTSIFPPNERGKALGLNAAAVYLGLATGPFLGGVLVQHLGWRSVFWINAPLGLVILLLLTKVEGEWAEAEKEKFDYLGSLLSGLSLCALMYGFSALPRSLGGYLLAAGLCVGLGFVIWESRIPAPVLNLRLFRQSLTFAFSNLAALINYSATYAVTFFLSLYLQEVRGLSPQHAGFILLSQPVVMTLGSPIAGWLSDRIEPRIIASLGMTLTTLGLFFLAFGLGLHTSTLQIVGILLLMGLGFALFASPNTNAVMSSVAPRFRAVASSVLAIMRLVGQTFSMGIAMLILGLFVGEVSLGTHLSWPFVQAARVAFLCFACLCFVGIFASLARGRIHGED
ncbi:MFS transporter [Desulfothermobacter acidiphilus]|uniref:MFS transporter n=1 Tax=Desulfothermobacter acidiphilus TaxID=1938353 RepID=UPI003F8C5973